MKADAYKADLRPDTMTKKLSDMDYREAQAYHAQMRDNLMAGDKIVSVLFSYLSAPILDNGVTILRRTATLLVIGRKDAQGMVAEQSIRVSDGQRTGDSKYSRHAYYAANDQYVIQLQEERTAQHKFKKLSTALENAINQSRNEQQLREAVALLLNPPAQEETTPNVR